MKKSRRSGSFWICLFHAVHIVAEFRNSVADIFQHIAVGSEDVDGFQDLAEHFKKVFHKQTEFFHNAYSFDERFVSVGLFERTAEHIGDHVQNVLRNACGTENVDDALGKTVKEIFTYFYYNSFLHILFLHYSMNALMLQGEL